jgi:hypothetical protein
LGSAIRIFNAGAQPNGALGARATTTAICDAAASGQSIVCGTGTVALLSYTGDAIKDFPANYGVSSVLPIKAGVGALTIASNWADFIDGSWNACLGSNCRDSSTGAGILTGSAYSGSNGLGATATNCTDWTQSAGNGWYGVSPYCYGVYDGSCLDGWTFNYSGGDCSSPGTALLCLCF